MRNKGVRMMACHTLGMGLDWSRFVAIDILFLFNFAVVFYFNVFPFLPS
jgi:hypothetical protein